MGNEIQTTCVSERFSSHTQARIRPAATRSFDQGSALRQTLIEAMVQAVAEGSDPRLGETRALA
jgi:hypothetical protein